METDMSQHAELPTIFVFNDTPVKVKPFVLLNLPALWAGITVFLGRKRPEWSWPLRLVVGGLSMLTWLIADIGHALAHTVSAKISGSPMDEIQIVDMPRTIYFDNNVPPEVHRMRALGGPVYSATGLAASFLLRLTTPKDSTARELAHWSALGHGLILVGSMAPLTIVDGGVILKWTLVERGCTEDEADQVVQKAGLIAGAIAIGAGATMATRRRWLPATGLIIAGVVALAAALSKNR
jgi:hypothetical protein